MRPRGALNNCNTHHTPQLQASVRSTDADSRTRRTLYMLPVTALTIGMCHLQPPTPMATSPKMCMLLSQHLGALAYCCCSPVARHCCWRSPPLLPLAHHCCWHSPAADACRWPAVAVRRSLAAAAARLPLQLPCYSPLACCCRSPVSCCFAAGAA